MCLGFPGPQLLRVPNRAQGRPHTPWSHLLGGFLLQLFNLLLEHLIGLCKSHHLLFIELQRLQKKGRKDKVRRAKPTLCSLLLRTRLFVAQWCWFRVTFKDKGSEEDPDTGLLFV